ncbi:MAG TPA: ABC transporter permease [Candidatus Limnocylindrales bacterium]
MGVVKAAWRILALVGKELIETFRRPGAVISLVLGPFLILAVFGIGYQGVKHDLRAVVVADPAVGMPTDIGSYQQFQTRGVSVVGVTADRAAAEAQLENDSADLVVIVPNDLRTALENGRQAQLTIEIDQTDPVQANYASFVADFVTASINRDIYKFGAEQGQNYAIKIGNKSLSDIPPEVIASPTVVNVVNLAPSTPGIESYFGPAALMLVLQHMAVTLLALSIVRDRTSGAMEVFRASPVRATELVTGKITAFGLLGVAVAAVSLALMVVGLHVPMLAPIGWVALVIGLVLLASLALGLLISVVSSSERQAVQLSMLLLLASMFFSGFVIRIEEFQPVVQAGAYLLPVTHGIRLLQDLLLRGTITHPWQLLALAGIAAVTLLLSWVLVRREMRPA